MNVRSLLAALTTGGKAAFLSSVFGVVILFVYGFMANREVIFLHTGLVTIAIISAFMGGARGTLADGTMGWVHGAMVSLLYLFAILVLKFFLFPTAVNGIEDVLFFTGVLFAGAMGGVAGINLRPIQRQRLRRKYLRGL